MIDLITNCGLSGTGIIFSAKNIKNSKSTILILLNIIFIIIYSIIAILSIGTYVNKRQTKKAIHEFNKYFNK